MNSHLPNRQIAFLFPGQGAQYPGMGNDFASHYPIAKQTFEEADDLLCRPLSREIFQGTRESLKETCTSQVALYVVSIALWRVVKQLFPDLTPYVCAGLSLGEYTALTAAGVLPFAQGLSLVQARGVAMHHACQQQAGGMEVVMGLSPIEVQEVIDSLAQPYNLQHSPSKPSKFPLWIANLNAPNQVVISGSIHALARAHPLLEQKGAKRVIALEVAGAFHSHLMQTAQEALAGPITDCPLQPSSCRLVMNVPGDFVEETEAQRQYLLQQVTHPVLWQQGIRKMDAAGVTDYIEIGPGKTLSGLTKRILPNCASFNIEKVEEISRMESLYATAAS